MTCGDNYIVFSFFLQNVNTVHAVYVEQENVCVDTKDVNAQNVKNGQFQLISS